MINTHLPYSITHRVGDREITVIYDTNFPFRFGTKIRKAESFFIEYINKTYDGVQLIGDPNSNFLSAFTHFFYTKGVNVYSIHHSVSKFHGPNRVISERFSKKFIQENKFAHKFETEVHPQFRIFGNLLVIPRWGISHISLNSMDSLWEYIMKMINIDRLFIDIGSGLTYLSCLNFFQNSKVSIVGMSIGLPQRKMTHYLENLEKHLYGRISQYIIEDVSGKFGRVTDGDILKLKKFREKGIYLEPIYSLRSFEKILEIQGREFVNSAYLHQGGLLTGISRGA